MKAVQTLRAQAKSAGNLKSGSQITVVQQSPQTIVIQPTNPQIVYVRNTTRPLFTALPMSFPATPPQMSWRRRRYDLRAWTGSWSDDEQRLGMQQLGLQLVRRSSLLSRRGLLRERRLARRLLRHQRGRLWSIRQRTLQPGYNPSTGTYARGASTSTAYGTQRVGQAYNPNTGAYGATHQGSNAYSNWGSSTVSKNGQTVDTQHYSDANGTVGTAESSNGNKYATANGNAYKNTGSGWESAGGSGSDAAHGYGDSSGYSGGPGP